MAYSVTSFRHFRSQRVKNHAKDTAMSTTQHNTTRFFYPDSGRTSTQDLSIFAILIRLC